MTTDQLYQALTAGLAPILRIPKVVAVVATY